MPRIGGSPRTTAYRPAEDDDIGDDAPRSKRKGDPATSGVRRARDGSLIVDLDDYRPKTTTYEMQGGDAVESDGDEPGMDQAGKDDFDRNLALDFDEEFLTELGVEIVELFEHDLEERQPWRDRFERGLEMMGLVESDIDDGPFPGASNVVHPLLIEARTQFWARAMGELYPPEGIVKAKIEGDQTEDLCRRGDRVCDYMNWQLLTEDEGYIEEKSQLTWDTPFYGSTFFKTVRDPIYNRNVGVYIPAEDFIVPAEAKSLLTTPRFCHRMRKFPNEVRRLQQVGFYRDVEIDLPVHEEMDQVEDLKHETQDTQPDADEETIRHEILEMCIEKVLPGDEYIDPETGKKTDLERSYYITAERHSQKILSIYRGWNPDDDMAKRLLFVEHYRYMPGQGFYGSGLFHLIGGLQIAATGALRVLLDSAASASLSGGFVSKHANLKGKRLVITPGHWESVDATADDLQKAFYSPPVKDPSPAMFQLLSFLTEAGEKFASTTELMTGDSDPKNSPVGTTNLMMEQGGKVMSTIHRMQHASLGRELRCRYTLDQQYVPAEGYPYDVAGQQRTVYADDFAPGLTVEPVSNPNIFSSQQRISLYQNALQIALQTGVGNVKKIVHKLFLAIKLPDVDDLIPDDPEPQAYDPVGEIQALLLGKPVKVLPEQQHVQHLQVLWAFVQNPQYGGNEMIQKQIGPNLMSIMGQHLAYAWTTHARGLGAPAGYMDPMSGQVQGAGGTPEQIGAMLAQLAPAMAQVPGLPAVTPPGEGGQETQAKMQLEYAKLDVQKQLADQKIQSSKDEHALKMQQMQDKVAADKQMNDAKIAVAAQKAQGDMHVAQMKTEAQGRQAQLDHQIQEQTAAQKMQQAEVQAQHQQQMDQQKIQGATAMHQQKMQQTGAMHQQKMDMTAQAGALKNQQAADTAAAQQEKAAMGAGQPQADRLTHLRRPHAPPHAGLDEGGMG